MKNMTIPMMEELNVVTKNEALHEVRRVEHSRKNMAFLTGRVEC